MQINHCFSLCTGKGAEKVPVGGRSRQRRPIPHAVGWGRREDPCFVHVDAPSFPVAQACPAPALAQRPPRGQACLLPLSVLPALPSQVAWLPPTSPRQRLRGLALACRPQSECGGPAGAASPWDPVPSEWGQPSKAPPQNRLCLPPLNLNHA